MYENDSALWSKPLIRRSIATSLHADSYLNSATPEFLQIPETKPGSEYINSEIIQNTQIL
jgi:hypothetical protein